MANKVIEVSRNVLVKISTDEGITGWGEAPADALLTGHFQAGIVAGVEFLAGSLLGEDPTRRTGLCVQMRSLVYGNSSAIGAIDVALHDIAGKAAGLPVYQMIGGAARSQVPVVALFGSGDQTKDLETATRLHTAGYRWFKIKLGLASPEAEAETLMAIRAALGDDSVLAGDANTAWTPPQAIRNLRLFDGAGLAFVEQPVGADDIEGMGRVAAAIRTPIGADESVHSAHDIVRLAAAGIAGVSLKLIKMGGITGVVHGSILAHNLGLAVNHGGKIAETSISAAALAHASVVAPSLGWGASMTHTSTDHDPVTRSLPVADGLIAPPDRPGLGVEVDEEAVAALVG
jgi:muconate cycloisomerase